MSSHSLESVKTDTFRMAHLGLTTSKFSATDGGSVLAESAYIGLHIYCNS
jgi:hypothetical protein